MNIRTKASRTLVPAALALALSGGLSGCGDGGGGDRAAVEAGTGADADVGTRFDDPPWLVETGARVRCGPAREIRHRDIALDLVVGAAAAPTPEAAAERSRPEYFEGATLTEVRRSGGAPAEQVTLTAHRGEALIAVVQTVRGAGGWAVAAEHLCRPPVRTGDDTA